MERKQILIVDDDPVSRAVMMAMIRSMDDEAEFWFAESAETACVLMREAEEKGKPHDLVLSDVFLPGGASGFDLWNVCQRRFPAAEFVMVSGLPARTLYRKVDRMADPPKFLPKPVAPRDLERVYRGVLGPDTFGG